MSDLGNPERSSIIGRFEVRSKSLTVIACFLIGGSAAVIEQVLSPPVVIAHGGRTDRYGCHNQNSNRTYHCHSGLLAGQSFANQAAMLAAMSSAPSAPSMPVPPAPPPDRPAEIPPSRAPTASPAVPYDRDLYRHWTDADGDCQDARQEVLIAESLQPPVMDDRACRVLSGLWFDLYTGQTFANPRDLDIDHFIPLAEVHRSGGDRWTAQQRENYANDLLHADGLVAVSASANRSKGDKDPAQWLPSNQGYRCEYVRTWIVIKATWGLAMDTSEQQAVQQVLAGCP